MLNKCLYQDGIGNLGCSCSTKKKISNSTNRIYETHFQREYRFPLCGKAYKRSGDEWLTGERRITLELKIHINHK